MGRESDLYEIGESPHGLEDAGDIGHLQHETPDGQSHNGHRGTRRVPIYDAMGNLAGIRRVAINGTSDDGHSIGKTSDGHRQSDHRGNRAEDERIGKTSDYHKVTDNRGNRLS